MSSGRPRAYERRRKQRALERQGGVCVHCGVALVVSSVRTGATRATWDHVEVRALGGPNTLDNMLLSCKRCNNLRGALPFLEFNYERRRLHGLPPLAFPIDSPTRFGITVNRNQRRHLVDVDPDAVNEGEDRERYAGG